MLAPLGAPAPRLNVKVCAGTSASVAVAVKLSKLPVVTVLLGIAASRGGVLVAEGVCTVNNATTLVAAPDVLVITTEYPPICELWTLPNTRLALVAFCKGAPLN